MTSRSTRLVLLVALVPGCGFFTSLDEYASGSVTGAGTGGHAGVGGAGGAGGASAACDVPDACSLPNCKSCSGDPDVCSVNVAADPDNCGDCGRSCGGGGCKGGACQPLVIADKRDRPAGIGLDGTRVFWLDQGSGSDGRVLSIGLAGGTVGELAEKLQSPLNLALDDQTVFFTFFTGGGGVAKVGKNAKGFAALTPSSGPWAIATSATETSVYWTSSDNSVRAIGKDGTNDRSLTLTTGVPRGIAIDDTSVYWTEACSPVATACDVGTLDRAPKDDGSKKALLASMQAFPIAVAVDGTSVYWINAGTSGPTDCTSNDGSVMRADKATGMNGTVLAGNLRCPQSLAIDGTHVYWTNAGSYNGTSYNGDGTVSSVPIAGGKVVVLATEQALPFGIAVDDKSIYWTEFGVMSGAGAVKKLAK